MSRTHPTTGRRLLQAGIATGAVTAAVIAGALPAQAAPVAMTLSATVGPSAGGNAVTGTVTLAAGAVGPFADGTTPVVQFQYFGTLLAATCRTAAPAATGILATAGVNTAGVIAVTGVQRINTGKIAFNVPTAVALVAAQTPAQTSAKFNVCVYDGPGTNLLATSVYTIATRPTITGVSPPSSPVLGGQSITINGTGFATTATGNSVSIGGAALTGLKVNALGTSISGITGPRGAGSGLAVLVTTPGGSVSSLDPDNDPLVIDTPIPFSYSNGATITPNTTPEDSSVSIDIAGVGFRALTFTTTTGTTPSDANSHVLLLSGGAYVPGINQGVEECLNVLVISDVELVCTLNLSDSKGTDIAGGATTTADAVEGTYTVAVVANALPASSLAVAGASIVNSGATFTVAPY